MASLTGRTKKIRARKRTKAGRARKRSLENNGSTPVFPVHKDGKKNPPSES